MADARTICKFPAERMSAFNKRLAAACDELAVTKFSILVVEGEPVVTLLSEEVQATEEDVQKDIAEREEARANGEEADPEDEALKVGDWIPAVEPLIVQVTKIGFIGTDEDAQKMEERCDVLYERAQGTIAHHLHATGTAHRWEGDPNSPLDASKQRTKFVHVPFSATYLAIGYLNADEGDDEDEGGDEDGGGDQHMERALRRGGKREPVTK